MTRPVYDIVLFGSGNAATQLGLALKKAGHRIVQVYSRSIESSRMLAQELGAKALSDSSAVSREADIYILAVKDDAVKELAGKLKLKKKIVLHTSGTLPLSVLKKASSSYGVIYPLQTLSKDRVLNMATVPICVEANTAGNQKIVAGLAKSISKKVFLLDSRQRAILHLAAIFAGNFTNHMYSIAEHLLSENQLPFGLLKPLIRETAEKIKEGHLPASVQTGPAARKDFEIMKTHLKMLSGEKNLATIYRLVSENIMRNKT